MHYTGEGDEVGKESASESCSKATEKILEKHQPGDPGEPAGLINTKLSKRCL